MKAIVLTRYGLPSELELAEIERPAPDPDEVLIKVKAASVNDWDWSLVRGKPFYIRLLGGFFRPRVRTPGVDVAGEVVAVGVNVTRFRPGQAVYGDLSESGFGGFAQFVCAPAAALATKPANITWSEAAAIPHAAMLAFQGLRDLGRLQAGQSLLINGAGGGFGTLGVQIAKAAGAAHVTGVDSAEKLDMMRSIGFDRTLDYRQHDFTESDSRYDLILDSKTNRSIFRYLRVLNPTGRYVTVGGSTARLLQVFLLSRIIRFFTNKRVCVLALKPNKDLEDLNALLESRKLKPVIDGPYPFDRTAEAIQRFGQGRHLGKIIIKMEDDER